MMAMTWALAMVAVLRINTATAADCEGVVFLNQTLMQFNFGRRMSEELPIDCHVPIEVDSSHCGYQYTPEYRVVHDDSDFYNCSFIVNPRATRFDLFCTFDQSYFLSFLLVGPEVSNQIASDEVQQRDGAIGSSNGSRRLSFLLDPLPEDVVIRWVANPPAYLEECNDTIVNLTRRVEDLEDIIDNLRTTETGTRTTDTTITQTTTTPDGATSTRTTTTSGTTSSETTTTVTTFLAPTATPTTTAAAPVDVVQAGATSDCDSLLALLIISVAFNVLFILIIILLLLRRREQRGNHASPSKSEVAVTPPSEASPVRSELAPRTPMGRSAHASSSGSRRVSFATESVPSMGSAENANVPPVASGHEGDESWAGRSIIYRYLKVGTRSGNRIKADFRRGPIMTAAEAPQLDDAASSAVSGSATPGRTISGCATPSRAVSHVSQEAMSSGVGILTTPGESSTGGRSRVPSPPPVSDDAAV